MDAFRLALGFVAALSMISGLECSPQGKAAVRKAPKEAPLIQAEPPRSRFLPSPDGHPRWSWPGMAHFDHVLADTRRDATPIRLALGRLEKHLDGENDTIDGVVLAISPEPGGATFELRVELAETDEAYEKARFWSHRGWTLATGTLADAEDGSPLVFEKETARIRLEPTYVSPDRALLDSIDDWAYVRALLESEPPVYEQGSTKQDEFADKEEEIAAARREGKNEQALALYRVWRPIGRCSMDSRPAEVARDYAELCYEMGKLGCFLQLQVQIMGNQFNRVAYSSYGEAAASTQAERLVETGLDVDIFLSGLALRFGGVSRRAELAPYRLARSIKEAYQTDVVAERLATWVKDPDFDEYNRLSAVEMLSLLERDALVSDEELTPISLTYRKLEREREEARAKDSSK